MPANPQTKQTKVCATPGCGRSMDGEHPAAKRCLKCRDPKRWEKENPKPQPVKPVMGDVVGPDPGEAKREQAEYKVPPPSEVKEPEPKPEPVVTPYFLKPGDIISLNLKQRKFLVLPRSGWKLSPRNWNGEIPTGIDPVELKMLRIALEAGDILKGKVYTGIKKDESTLNKASMLLELDEQSLRNALGKIVQHRGLVGGYLAREIFRYLVRFEDDNEHRRPVLDLLQNAIDHVAKGPLSITPVVSKPIEEVVEREF